MKVAVIGSGLGGMLSAAILSEKGFEIDVFEKLPFIGGRFTNIEYKGFQLSTGALHMVPHGSRGPLAKLLRRAGAKVEIVDSKPAGEALYKGRRTEIRKKKFPLKSRLNFIKWCLKSRFREVKISEFENDLDDFSRGFLRAFLGWSLSITPDEAIFSKILPIYHQTVKCGGPGIPIGGCKSVIDALTEIVTSNDGRIRKRTGVKAIKPQDYGFSVYAGKDIKHYDIVISNIGHVETGKLLNNEYATHVEPSSGIKYSISLKEPFIGHTGVLFTFNTRRISGMNEVTNADPNLGKGHLLMAHQPVLTNNIRYEIAQGLKDLREILKGHEYEILAIQSYSDGWPVNRVKAGQDIGFETPYRNLYVVGDGAKGDDIEVEGIALGVERVIKRIEEMP
ncbi:NAD(P)-binding protein [Archaeoglobus veneficus]|uniref:Amine oxidase n=1 Tax=Archaeoglobus veneficus (strain DSM 11195 / SNP6) TaxID=693661 RepID=F2KNH4_ARCVS|nr:NAD(P)-binding protein [Archaeoglobus veneficus]AEA47376.1 amine oxidase [Archaeoglobus veneficus SNP6]